MHDDFHRQFMAWIKREKERLAGINEPDPGASWRIEFEKDLEDFDEAQRILFPKVTPLTRPEDHVSLSRFYRQFWSCYHAVSAIELGGRVIKLGDVAAELKITERSVRHQIKSLGEAGYLRKRFASRGVRIELKLWKWDEGFGGFVPAEGLDHSPVRQKDVRHQKPCMTIKRESKDSVSPEIVMQQRPARQMGAMQDVILPSNSGHFVKLPFCPQRPAG